MDNLGFSDVDRKSLVRCIYIYIYIRYIYM